MSDATAIVRIAAKGDGVTQDGRHVPGAVTGDGLTAEGELLLGPHHAAPVCRHFETCGACQLQHADETALRQFVRDRVVGAASGQGIAAQEEEPTYLSPPRSRRRATLHFQRTGKRILLGFKAERSHRIVDMQECHVLHPSLFETMRAVRSFLSHWPQARAGSVGLSLIDQGIDLSIEGAIPEGLEQTESLTQFARQHSLARLSIDYGYGAQSVWEPNPVTVTLSGARVPFPQGAFLQATKDAEAVLTADAHDWLDGASRIGDLFCGLGTFAFALDCAESVTGFEASQAAVTAARSANRARSGNIEFVHRDLFRRPLEPSEIAGFDALILDPPRAGAREQVGQIARSDVSRIVYISCNPASWARDARTLVDAGFHLRNLRPVGQFRWSTHVELASHFVRHA